jgi:hypothetical protein
MDHLLVGFGASVCQAVSASSQCYNPDFTRAVALTLIVVAAGVLFGGRMLRSS